MLWIEIVGIVGGIGLLLAYYLASVGKLLPESYGFQVINFLGSAGLLINATYHQAYPSASVNLVWCIVGTGAMLRLRKKHGKTGETGG